MLLSALEWLHHALEGGSLSQKPIQAKIPRQRFGEQFFPFPQKLFSSNLFSPTERKDD
jgi:hypothetical protein